MIAKLSNAEKQFEALRNSGSQLNRLRIQVEQTQKQHASLVKKFLDAVERNPSKWKFKIVQKKRTIAEGLLNKKVHEILRAIVASPARLVPGEGVGCSDRAGCSIVVETAIACVYICRTVD